MSELQFTTFFVDGAYFGVEVTRVQEALRHLPTTSVPLADHVVAGLINLRGQIVTAVDLRRRLGMPDRTDGRPAMNVVVRGDEVVSLLVDEIGEVVDVDVDAFEPPPDTLTGTARELITGAYKLDGRLLLVLDTDKALAPVGLHA